MKHVVYLAIIGILLYMLYNADPQIVTKQVKGDTTIIIDTLYVQKYVQGETDTVTVDSVIYVDVPYMDTLEMKRLVKEYMAKSILVDTLDIKYGKVFISDTVQMNRIKRNWSASLNIPVEKQYITIPEQPKVKVFFGPNVTVSPYVGIGVNAILKSKTDKLYGINIGLSNKGLSYGATYMIKL
jgi:hypothetical protein